LNGFKKAGKLDSSGDIRPPLFGDLAFAATGSETDM
jgi:hypothetical protein